MLLTLAREEQVHREVYIALLGSAAAILGGKRRLAERAGISQQYLSYLLHPDPSNLVGARRPSLRVAGRLAAVLPLDPELRESVRDHMALASEARLRSRREIRAMLAPREIPALLGEIRGAHAATTSASDPATSQAPYRAVRDLGRRFLDHVTRERHPLDYIEACFLVHDAQCVLDRPDDALYRATLARALVEHLATDPSRRDRARLDSLHVQAIRAEAVALNNLGLSRRARDRSHEAEATDAMRRAPDAHLPYVYRDRINALLDIPRFSLGEVEELAGRALATCERRAGALDPLWALLISCSLANARLRYGKTGKAAAALRGPLEWLDRTPGVGPLHRVLLLKSGAAVRRALGEEDVWQHYAGRALDIALAAGLTHQARDMRRAFGPAVDALLAERGATKGEDGPGDGLTRDAIHCTRGRPACL